MDSVRLVLVATIESKYDFCGGNRTSVDGAIQYSSLLVPTPNLSGPIETFVVYRGFTPAHFYREYKLNLFTLFNH